MSNKFSRDNSMLLRNARVVSPDELLKVAGVLIKGGRIERIFGTSAQAVASAATTEINLEGLTLYPGFIDVHNHGAVSVDTMEATTGDLRKISKFLASCGVTAWLPTFVPAPDEDYARGVRAIEQLMREQDARPPAARALGVHYEGPFVNAAQCGALRTAHFRVYSKPSDLDALTKVEHDGSVHMITVAPEIDGGVELVRELAARGWVVSIGHTRAGVETLDQARAAGARHMTHFPNAMQPLHHRAPGPIGWGLINDDITCDVIADGIHVDPLMLRLVLRSKTPARIALISDAVAPTGLGDGEYHIWGETINVIQGRTQNSRGSIAGSVITMRDAVRMMLSLDVPLQDVAQMASTAPARLLGLHQEYGSIEIGKRADLVALDREGNVRLTLIGGRVAYE